MDNKNIPWNETHERLQALMQKEVGAMREVLANMHQEELSILLKDTFTWNQVMQQRAVLVDQLSSLRAERIEMTKKLQSLISEVPSEKELPLESLLPANDGNSCEILSLRDQIMALVERMNMQNSRNNTLFSQIAYRLDIAAKPMPQPAPQKAKRKPTLATYPEKE